MAWTFGCMAAKDTPPPLEFRTVLNAALAIACRHACSLEDLESVIRWVDQLKADLDRLAD